tara:strand:- start:59456 stop:59800 length:345 start_codon:yes stop_codon:yes gene_type:complete
MTEQVVQVGLYLGLIVVLILAFGFVAKRLGQHNFQGGGAMKIVSSLPLGIKEKLLLVQVGDQQILIGVTPTNISRIESFDGVVLEPAPKSKSSTGGGGDFRHKLQEIMQHNQAR